MTDASPAGLPTDRGAVTFLIKRLLRRLGFDVSLCRTRECRIVEAAGQALRHYHRLPPGLEKDFLRLMHQNLMASRAQIHQDAFVLALTGEKRGGFFCEFGAADGLHFSNSWLLETRFGWRGILGEPGRGWHGTLRRNRPGVALETRCVWSHGGESLTFREAENGEFSTLQQFVDADRHAAARRVGTSYQVPTVTLTEMLANHGAPPLVDYLSIDTEGSEYEILAAHDFDRYRFSAITVEHNYTPTRERIHALLTGHGYRRVLMNWSEWDDWYVHGDVSIP